MDQYEKNILNFGRELSFANLPNENWEVLNRYAKPDGLIIYGLGGSGLPGTLLKGLTEKSGLRIPILVWKNFGLPKHNFKRPLHVFISFSGQTQEILSGLKILLRQKLRTNIAVVTTDGELKTLARKFKLPMVNFRADHLTPREALGRLYYSLNKILRSKGIFTKTSDLSSRIHPQIFVKLGQKIAKAIRYKIPLIYTDSEHDYLGYVWKTNLNETAKQPAFNNVLPEADHNELNALENKKFPFFVLFLKDLKQSKSILEKFKATEKVIKQNRVPHLAINLQGKTEEEKTWNAIVLSHLVSFYLARLNKVNPTQTRLINQLKKLTK